MKGIKQHMNLVDWYCGNPNEIEKGFKVIFKEFGVGNWRRVDILGVDREKNLCIVEVKSGKHSHFIKQVQKYRSSLNKLFQTLNLLVPIRLLVITPKKHFDLGCSQPELKVHPKIPNGLPTSKELFGLKGGILCE